MKCAGSWRHPSTLMSTIVLRLHSFVPCLNLTLINIALLVLYIDSIWVQWLFLALPAFVFLTPLIVFLRLDGVINAFDCTFWRYRSHRDPTYTRVSPVINHLLWLMILRTFTWRCHRRVCTASSFSGLLIAILYCLHVGVYLVWSNKEGVRFALICNDNYFCRGHHELVDEFVDWQTTIGSQFESCA